MSRMKIDRRRFLSAVGAGAAAVPFLRGLPGFAAGEDRRYLILLFSPNGVVRHLWGATPGATPADFTLRPWLAPLAPYKDKMIVVRGLANMAAGTGDPHGPGMASLWTGVPTKNQELASGQSIDQAIAAALNPPTPYSSLEFRAKSPEDYEGKSVTNRMIYSTAGTPKDPREDPTTARDQLFLGIGGGTSTTPAPVDPKIEVRRQVFARLDGELGRMLPRLCNGDKRHLDALRTGWSTLNGRLGGSVDPTLLSCKFPDTITGAKPYPMMTRQMIDLLVMSLACDLTRVASLQFSQALSPMVPSWLGITGDHHNISHAVPQRYALGPQAPIQSDADNPLPSQVANIPAIDQMTQINLFYAGEVAYLCQRLSQVPVDGGKTLLDQCIIAWGNELDNGSAHDHWDMPFVVIGGGGGRLKTNQYVQLMPFNGYGLPTDAIYMAQRSHNDLLVTLAQAMGANIPMFGDARFNKGALTQMLV
jgi:hypothetical protein